MKKCLPACIKGKENRPNKIPLVFVYGNPSDPSKEEYEKNSKKYQKCRACILEGYPKTIIKLTSIVYGFYPHLTSLVVRLHIITEEDFIHLKSRCSSCPIETVKPSFVKKSEIRKKFDVLNFHSALCGNNEKEVSEQVANQLKKICGQINDGLMHKKTGTKAFCRISVFEHNFIQEQDVKPLFVAFNKACANCLLRDTKFFSKVDSSRYDQKSKIWTVSFKVCLQDSDFTPKCQTRCRMKQQEPTLQKLPKSVSPDSIYTSLCRYFSESWLSKPRYVKVICNN